MKLLQLFKGLVMTSALLLTTSFIFSQAKPPASPAATATGTLKNGAHITISYSSPAVKGREIWGALVPFDKVWRAGANNATLLETDKDVKVEGKTLAAGKYSIYAIPGEKEWVIIINSVTGQAGMNHDGSTTLDPAKDVMRVTVKSKKSATMNERLVYTINEQGFVLSWEYLDVPVSIK